MLIINESVVVLIFVWAYMFIYSCSIFLLFFSLFQMKNPVVKTLHSFSSFGSTNFIAKQLMIALFSMAGVPPFWGFFAKMLLLVLLLTSSFALLFPFFFIILFLGLYFYVQNIRFLNSSHYTPFSPLQRGSLSTPILYYSFALVTSFFLIFGCFFMEDLILVVT